MVGISCNADEIAGPTEPKGAPEVEAAQAVSSSLRFLQVSAGTGNFGAHSCGVTTTHRVYCWGSNSSGELGNGKFGFEVRPVRVAAEVWFNSVSTGFFHTCGVARNGLAYCWGEGATGALGNGRAGSEDLPTDRRNKPTLVTDRLRFLQVAAGHSHTCGITTANKVYCWGDNSEGQLGDGTIKRRLSPKLVHGGRRFLSVSVGVGHSCAVTTEYQAFCWGSGGDGRLGNGSTRSSLRPVAVATSRKFREISAGYFHTCAMGRDNRAYCWGEGIAVGDGAGVDRLVPVAVGGSRIQHVEAGSGHTCGNGYDGQGYCWGSNYLGELGIGSSSLPRLIPDAFVARRPEVNGYIQLSAGDVHSCGIADTGKAYCWGFNGSGQLGDGTLEWSPTPNPVADPL
jgi:alpha-tubulin suppressor-like RCC1 family protein